MEKMIAGLAVGTVLGALIVANSNKTRTLVQKGQDEMREKIDAYIDEKIAALDHGSAQKCGDSCKK